MPAPSTEKTRPVPAGPVAWRTLARRWLAFLLAVDVAFIATYSYGIATGRGMSRGLFYLVQLDGEANATAWWSSAKLLLVGFVFLVLASRLFERDELVRPFRRAFLLLAVAFTYLSADEAGTIHERISRWSAAHAPQILALEQRLVEPLGFTHTLRGGGLWIIMYGIAVLVMLVLLAPDILRALRVWRAQSLLLGAGLGLLVAGGVVTEIVGYFIEIDTGSRFLQIGIEESLEMVGGSLLVVAVMAILARAGERLVFGAPAVLSVVEPAAEPGPPSEDVIAEETPASA